MANNNPTEKIKALLNAIKDLGEKLDLEKVVYNEGTNVGQIAFHVGQSANYWIRVNILNQEFPRNRDAEFNQEHTLEEVLNSINLALKACEELDKKNFSLDKKLEKQVEVSPGDFIIDTVGAALIYSTSHTAEHYGELSRQL